MHFLSSFYSKYTWSLLLASLMVATFVSPVPVSAAEGDAAAKKVERRKSTPAMSQKVYRKLSEVQAIIQGDSEDPNAKVPPAKLNEALEELADIERSKKLTDYERAQINNIKAFIFYLKSDIDSALKAYLAIVNSPATPEGLYLSTLRTVTQLYMVKEQYQKAIASGKQLLADSGRDGTILALIATAYYQTKDNKTAFRYIKEAVDQYLKSDRKPREQWLVLLRYLYLEKNQNANATNILKTLVRLYPRSTYLLNLASAYGLESKDSKQLAVMELLYDGNYLKNEGEYRNLTGLMLNLGISFKASRILEDLVKDEKIEETERNLLLLSQAYYQSHQVEKSIPPLLKAAKKANTGDLYLRLAYSYSGIDGWSNVVKYTRKALSIGKLKDDERARILLGTALFNLEKYTDARDQFMLLKDSEENDTVAREWITYINGTIDRQKILARIREDANSVTDLDALRQLNQVIN